MYKLWVAIQKDSRILFRDKAALAIMFAMPVLLAVVISSIQNSAFEVVNNNKVSVIICNRDRGESSTQLVDALEKIGMFNLTKADFSISDKELTALMHQSEAMISIVIPAGFSSAMSVKAQSVSGKALKEFGMEIEDSTNEKDLEVAPLTLYYNPVLQEAFRYSVQGALRSAQQFTENRQILQALYLELNNQPMPDSLEQEILGNQTPIAEIPVAKDGSRVIPNTTQHNVPAWTIFAMFFIVVILSANVVKEKLTGSFVRLKTLPTNFYKALAAKQITYIMVTLAQVVAIFSLGIYLFPLLGLPKLVLPEDFSALLLVSIACGWCAVSYGIALGVYAKTMEQAIGFGAVSVVILAAIGGIIVPAFAMPETLQIVMKISPLYWCLEAYYTLFLEGGLLKDVLQSLVPLLAITFAFQLAAIAGLKRQNLI